MRRVHCCDVKIYTWKGHLKVQERLQNVVYVPCVWRVSQLQRDRSSCRPYSHKHSEAAFINHPPTPLTHPHTHAHPTPLFKKKKKTENGARTLEPSSCCWNFSGLICINKEAVPCRNVFYPAQKIPGRSLSVEHWENPTVRADKTNESRCQRRVAPR